MSSRFPELVAAALLLMGASAEAREIRVCADPDNLPFSNQAGQGFENRILDLVAREIDARITYVWTNERRATAIEVMNKGRCDLVPGALAGAPGVATTRAYMRSSYAMVLRGGESVAGFDDPKLHAMKIGVQSVGDDAVTPPVAALLNRGLSASIRPYTLHGSAADPDTAGQIVQAVAARDIDAAVLWGPFAGYFAARQAIPLEVSPVAGGPADPPMSYAIAMAVRSNDRALREEIDRALAVHRDDIAKVLADDHVPLLPLPPEEASP